MNDTLVQKIKALQCLILDVDGVMTNGMVYYLSNGDQYKAFDIQDGYGIEQLQKNGITVAIISGKKSPAVDFRAKELNIQHVYQACDDKMAAFKDLLAKTQFKAEQVAFMGDDCPDLPLMEHVGLRIAVANAVDAVQSLADWKTEKAGGFGAVREVCDQILKVRHDEK